MGQPRYVETGKGSFFGDYVYDQVVPADHFLRKLNEVIDWKRYTRKLIGLYKGEGLGTAAIRPGDDVEDGIIGIPVQCERASGGNVP